MLLPSDFDLPSLDDFKKILEDLSNLDINGATIEEIEKEYLTKIPFFPRMVSLLHFEKTNHLPFYRVRMNIDPEIEDLTLIRTYSYPSSSQCTLNGRANRKGKSVFYCSNSAIAAVLECKPNVGDIGYLSVWKNNFDRETNTAIYMPEVLPGFNEFQQISTEAHKYAKAYYREHGNDKYEHFLELNNFVVSQFVNEKYPYTLTSYLCDKALFRDNAKDVIMYPSIASDSRYCNFAFHPNVVDKYLSFERVIRFKVTNKDPNGSMQFGIGKIGEIIQNSILWRKGKEKEKDFLRFPGSFYYNN